MASEAVTPASPGDATDAVEIVGPSDSRALAIRAGNPTEVVLVDPAWKAWYRSEHNRRCLAAGKAFEDYATDLLRRLHSDFQDPESMGRSGDQGCDGLAEMGAILYACYGADLYAGIDTEDRLKDRRVRNKLAADFTRGVGQWDFSVWHFVTNAAIGPETLRRLTELQREHAPGTPRPVTLDVWQAPDDLWFNVANKLTATQLDEVMPGVPRARDIKLADLVELIDRLESGRFDDADTTTPILPVPHTKMDFNAIPEKTRIEFNEGRIQAARIDHWFAEQTDPGLRDAKARRFKEIYLEARAVTVEPAEVVEAVYTALGGEGFRRWNRRANAVYSVTAYFFDSCDIFESPPAASGDGGEPNVVTNEGD